MSTGEFFVDHPILRRFVASTEAILKEQIAVTDRGRLRTLANLVAVSQYPPRFQRYSL
jgi:hypothetical protein